MCRWPCPALDKRRALHNPPSVRERLLLVAEMTRYGGLCSQGYSFTGCWYACAPTRFGDKAFHSTLRWERQGSALNSHARWSRRLCDGIPTSQLCRRPSEVTPCSSAPVSRQVIVCSYICTSVAVLCVLLRPGPETAQLLFWRIRLSSLTRNLTTFAKIMRTRCWVLLVLSYG